MGGVCLTAGRRRWESRFQPCPILRHRKPARIQMPNGTAIAHIPAAAAERSVRGELKEEAVDRQKGCQIPACAGRRFFGIVTLTCGVSGAGLPVAALAFACSSSHAGARTRLTFTDGRGIVDAVKTTTRATTQQAGQGLRAEHEPNRQDRDPQGLPASRE